MVYVQRSRTDYEAGVDSNGNALSGLSAETRCNRSRPWTLCVKMPLSIFEDFEYEVQVCDADTTGATSNCAVQTLQPLGWIRDMHVKVSFDAEGAAPVSGFSAGISAIKAIKFVYKADALCNTGQSSAVSFALAHTNYATSDALNGAVVTACGDETHLIKQPRITALRPHLSKQSTLGRMPPSKSILQDSGRVHQAMTSRLQKLAPLHGMQALMAVLSALQRLSIRSVLQLVQATLANPGASSCLCAASYAPRFMIIPLVLLCQHLATSSRLRLRSLLNSKMPILLMHKLMTITNFLAQSQVSLPPSAIVCTMRVKPD